MTDQAAATAIRLINSLNMRGIVKRFPGVLANDHINLEIKAGQIHALLGENGAGKSTLMKILFGLYQPEEGQILVNNNPIQIASPADAIKLGIGMIHQHFMLVPSLSVVENVALGLPSTRGMLLDLDQVARRIGELSELYGLRVDPHQMVWQLAVGEQQRVEILKALYRNAALLVLDEPTAVLTPQECTELFGVLRQMANRGHALIFITHKLHEALEISDVVTVLRGGRVVQTLTTLGTTRELLARLMVGREVSLRTERPPVEIGETRLKLDNLWADSDKPGIPALRGISLEVQAGEILGIAGVSGNGQRELAEVIAGLRSPTRGRVAIEGRDVTGWSPDQLLRYGLSYVPEERMRDGVIRNFTVAENLILRDHSKPTYSDGQFLNFRRIAKHTDKLIFDFDVKTPSRETPLKHLSGGNIQKLILARELSRKPRVLVAAQPTRGVDIGATEYIHQLLIGQRQAHTATLLISEDLDEVRRLSDRIAVMYEGQIIGIVHHDEADIKQLGLMMAGIMTDGQSSL